jgi:2-polyprenyl-3-methyl-5-hydroxy-6-metoxy-1,4-benzoquinol methylase
MEGQDLYQTYRSTFRPAARRATAAGLFVDSYLEPHLSGLREEHILELGSGEGDMLAALRSRGFSRIRGSDMSPSQVEAARKNGVEVDLCDGRTALQSAKPGSLAAVIALDVLEHLQLEETLEWLAIARRSLRDGGLMLLRVPNGEGLFGGAIRYGDITHRTAYTKGSLEQLFFARGFETLEVRPCRPVAHGVASLARVVAWRMVEAFLYLANAAESGQRSGACFTRNIFAVGRRNAG